MHALEEDIAKYEGEYDYVYAPIREQRIERVRELGLVSPEWDPAPQVGDSPSWKPITRSTTR
jgi:arylsulfatase